MNGDTLRYHLTDGVLRAPAGTEQCGVPRRDRQLLDVVWPELSVELARLALALGLAREEAEDAVQDVYMQAVRKCPAGLSRVEIRRWLFRVATNRCRLEHRRHRRWSSVVEGIKRAWHRDNGQARAAAATGRDESHDERRRVVQQGLDSLEEDTRTLLVLRYFAGFNSREIGRMLDLPDATVRGRLRQARMRLAKALEGTGYDEA